MICLCGSELEIENCCGVYISGQKTPKTAEQLMRARYTAYSQVQMDFIESTHDPKLREGNDMEANQAWAESTSWLELQIIKVTDGGEEDDTGVVEFKAKFDAGQGEEWHHEVSQFVKRKGKWYFSDSKNPNINTFKRESLKVGRNNPCPCGSGKKYKKCCA